MLPFSLSKLAKKWEVLYCIRQLKDETKTGNGGRDGLRNWSVHVNFWSFDLVFPSSFFSQLIPWGPVRVFGLRIIRGFLQKGYGLLATKFKDYGLFVWHFKITDYYRSLSNVCFRDIFVYKIGIRIISKIYPGLRIIQTPLNRAPFIQICFPDAILKWASQETVPTNRNESPSREN